VTGYKGIVKALLRLWEAGEASQLTEGAEQFPPSGESLMDVALVTHVKDQPVLAGVVDPMEGYRQLHRSQIGSQMSTGAGNGIYQKLAQLTA